MLFQQALALAAGEGGSPLRAIGRAGLSGCEPAAVTANLGRLLADYEKSG